MRRLLISATLICAVAATVLLPAHPASAYTDATHLTIGLGEHKLIKRAPIVGMSVSFQASAQTNAYPADCDTDPVGCEVIPLDLTIPEDDPDAIEAQAYLLTVVVSYDPGQTIENIPGAQVGTIRQNDLETYLFQDPNVRNSSGTATYTAWSHGNSPGTLSAVSPTSKKFNLVVANFNGVNNGYTLELSLIKADEIVFKPGQYSNFKPPAYVQPTFTPPASSPQQNGFGGANLPPSVTVTGGSPQPAVDGAGSLVVPNIADGQPDAGLLAMSKVVRATGLGRKSVKVDSTLAKAASINKDTTSVVTTLLILPVVALVAGVVLLARRRKVASAAV